MLSPIIKSKYQLPSHKEDSNQIDFIGNSSLRRNQLRNSGMNNFPEGDNLLSHSIDGWSMGKNKLSETVRSDEFLNSKLYTNTQKIQAIDIIDYSQQQN
jgi:hypothetical protein